MQNQGDAGASDSPLQTRGFAESVVDAVKSLLQENETLRREAATLRNEVLALQANLMAQVEVRHQLEVRLKDAGLL